MRCNAGVLGQLIARLCWGTVAVVLGLLSSPVGAHGRLPDPNGPHNGLFVPPVMHPQMPAMAAEAGATRRVAEQLLWDDRDGRRLLQFLEYQSFACLWGRVPGSITDENSPFNRCAHAYLAGVQALLVRLQLVRGDHAAVRRLTQAIADDPMAAAPLCQFSAEGFWTGTIIGPDWPDLLHHPEVLTWFGGLLLLAGSSVFLVIAGLRRLPARVDQPSFEARGQLAGERAD